MGLSAKIETRPEHELVVNIFSHAFTRSTKSRARSSTRPARLLSSSSLPSSLVITKLETVALFLRSKLSSFCIIIIIIILKKIQKQRKKRKKERNDRRRSVHLLSLSLSLC